MKKPTRPLPEWAVGLIQRRLWEIERLQLYDPFRVSHTIEIRSRDGEPKESTGNRVGEESSRESEGSGAIFDEAAVEWGVEGLPQ